MSVSSASESPRPCPPPASSGLICLCVVAGHHQRSADPLQLARALGVDASAPLTEAQLLLAAKELGLKAKMGRSNWSRLSNITLPAIVKLQGGEYVVLLRRDADGHVIVGDPRFPRPQRFDQEQFEERWTGRLVLVKTRLRLDNPNQKEAASKDTDTRSGAPPSSDKPTSDPSTTANIGYVYRVHIRTTGSLFVVRGAPQSVLSGMTVQADITTDLRRVIEFFLSPLVKYLDEGLKVR